MASGLVFMGSPEFALPFLDITRKFAADINEPVHAVFTQPDRPKGRGQTTPTPPPVARAAQQAGLKVFQPVSLRKGEDAAAAIAYLHEKKPRAIVVVAYGLLLPKSVLEIPEFGCINVHTSLLPALRGAAPTNWAILQGAATTGVSTMRLDEGMDTGPVFLQRETPIGAEEDAAQLLARLQSLGTALLRETLDGLWRKSLIPKPQSQDGASQAPLLKKSDGQIDWTKQAAYIHRQVRGLVPWPGTQTSLLGESVKIHRVLLPKRRVSGRKPGEVIGLGTQGLEVVCGGGEILEVLELQRAGGRRQNAQEFWSGVRGSDSLIFGS